MNSTKSYLRSRLGEASSAARVGLFLLALTFCARAFAADPPAADAVLLTAEGTVQVSPTGQTAWSAGKTNQTLKIGDRVRTAARSRATVRLSNLTVLRVNELTTLQIQPPSAPGKQAALDVKNGAAYFFSRERPTEMEFRTPLASGAIRGTEFNIAVADDGKTVVTLIDGAVALNNERGSVDLASGEQGTVEPGKAPTKTAVIEAVNIIQWCLYYPAVIDPDELNFTDAEKEILAESLKAYRSGDLLAALANYPAARAPVSDSEKVFVASLLLSVGQVTQAENELNSARVPAAAALRGMIVTVKHQPWSRAAKPALASELMTESYYLQSQSQLEAARDAARKATEKSPGFGFAWERLAEMEFSFGRVPETLAALNKSLELSPRNAQALALKGFVLAAQNKISEAQDFFEQAIAIDGALGNAWLGRGLTKIRQGKRDDGLRDLQTAATLEPQRAVLRSYLGKAFNNTKDNQRADRELNLAKKFDPNDPTPWLYSALLAQQENKVNEAIRDLEKSRDLNDNRRIYRSRLLLDQDRAVRSANLAAVYKDAGMDDWSVREASRAVNSDYANFSAHLFLANSYDALRDPKQINLRYETPAFAELFLSQLLAPVGAGNLSSYVSQQEYSKLLEHDGLGVSSATEYFSHGDWHETASQYGTFGNFSYALDAEYRSERGFRPNNDLEQTTYYLKAKAQVTPQDSLFFGALLYKADFGDVAQYYNQDRSITAVASNPDGSMSGVPAPSLSFRGREVQEPNIFVGYHHEWSPASHTLFLFGHLDDTLSLGDTNAQIPFVRYTSFTRELFEISARPFPFASQRHFDANLIEAQHIWQTPVHSLVVGARYLNGEARGSTTITNPFVLSGLTGTPTVTNQHVRADLERISGYGYYQLQPADWVRLFGGVSYDYLKFPRNVDTAPMSSAEADKSQISPKAGFIVSPFAQTHLRGAYTRSLGGAFYDASVRLEPVQVAGFNQAFRSIAPESAVGLVPGTKFETFGLALEQSFKSGTYFNVEAELLKSEAARTVGAFTNTFGAIPRELSGTRQTFDFKEKSLTFTLNQLVSRDWSLGARYRLSHADLDGRFPGIPDSVKGEDGFKQNQQAILHQVNLFAVYNIPCGFFARGDAIWTQQSNRGYNPDIPGDDFWQFNLFAGYRFYHRAAEVRLGLLNVADQDYRLNPLNLYNELPRERTLAVSFKFYF